MADSDPILTELATFLTALGPIGGHTVTRVYKRDHGPRAKIEQDSWVIGTGLEILQDRPNQRREEWLFTCRFFVCPVATVDETKSAQAHGWLDALVEAIDDPARRPLGGQLKNFGWRSTPTVFGTSINAGEDWSVVAANLGGYRWVNHGD